MRSLLAFRLTAAVAWLALSLSCLPGRAAEPPAQPLQGVRVLISESYYDLLALPLVRRLEAQGAQVRGGDLSTLTWDTARQYNLIIVVQAGQPVVPKDGDGPVQVLDRFVKAGGGVLFFKDFLAVEGADKFLAPFGATIQEEAIQDPAHAYTPHVGFTLPYAYTTVIAPGHPVTAGVKMVWYNAQDKFIFGTRPLQVSRDWQVLVTAEPGATTVIPQVDYAATATKPGTLTGPLPMVAAREYGAGAVVLIGITPMEILLGQGLPAYMDVAMERGDGTRASNTGKLYTNAVAWLAAHATKATDLAQGDLKPVVPGFGVPDLHDWTKDNFGGDLCTTPARGVVGVHSTLSDGKATPQALIAKGKALGLNWIAFTERLENFSPVKWEQLRKICKEASTPQFAALPGLDYMDNSGTRWVVYGDFDWPPPKVFSPDGQKIIVPEWWFSIQTPPNGPYDLGHAPLRVWDLSMWNMCPLRTTLAGAQVDEAVEAYRYAQGEMDDPFPMAVDMVSDEAGLEAASHRSLNYITQDQPGDLAAFYRYNMYFGGYRGFMSDGPLVTDWRAVNGCRITGGKWWLPGTEQYQVKLSVHSAAAITDIAIYDGPVLYRRFHPNQEKVTLLFNLPHDMQHNLTAEITDAAGKRAFTGGLFIRDFLNFRFMCGDRGNAICDGVVTDEVGPYLTGPTAPYQHKEDFNSDLAAFGSRPFTILPPEFDGGMRSIAMYVRPWFDAKDFPRPPQGSTPENRDEIAVCSPDGLLQGDEEVGYFAGPTTPWTPRLPRHDLEGVHAQWRSLAFYARAHDPGVILVEGTMKFDRDTKVDGVHVYSQWISSGPGEGDHYTVVTPDMNVSGLTGHPIATGEAKMIPGSYMVAWPSLWGSTGVLALDDGYSGGFYANAPSVSLVMSLTGMPRQMKAGDEITWRYVLLRGPVGEPSNTLGWENFAKTMGFRGAPAYQVTNIKAGAVTGTKFLLELTPTDGGFVGTVSAAQLPMRLPVRIADMNPNNTCGWFDLDRKEWHPSAIDRTIQQGFFTLDTSRGATRFFAGEPILADDPDLRIAVFSDAQTKIEAELNNVKDQPATVTLRLNPALGDAPPQQLTLQPGELKRISFAWTPK
jgi:hypothetical protein